MTINVNCPPRGLFIGHETENGARALTVDFSAWAAEYSTGTLQILFQRPGTESPYAVVLTRDGTTATWKPSETDLAEAGTGAVQIIYTVGDVRVKTSIIPVMVEPSLGVETDPPDGWTSWIDQLTDLAAVTEQHAASAAESAENAGDSATDAQRYATDAGDAKNAAVAAAEAAAASASHYPQIVNGVWYVWSPSAGAYISTGIDAQGEDGVSPTVEITAIQGGHRVVITDAEGSHTFDVMDGVTPDLSAYRTAADQDEIDDAQDEELNNLKSALNAKAGILRDTVSGSVASFTPDATVPNLLGLSVALEPIQDLHGYDSPWPAGGGKNKFGCADGTYAIGATRTVTVADGVWTYKVNIAATSSVFLPEATVAAMAIPALQPGTYTFSLASNAAESQAVASAVLNLADGQSIANGGTFTINESTAIVSITTLALGWFDVGTYTCQIQIESGSTPSAWVPYSNLCPISGRDSVEVDATGVNVLNPDGLVAGLPSTTIGASISNITPSTRYAYSPPINASKGLFVTAHSLDASKIEWCAFLLYNNDLLVNRYFLSITGATPATQAVAVATYEKAVIVFGAPAGYAALDGIDSVRASITLGSTATEYKPYAGTTHTITLGQTVYGGTLDVTAGTNESAFGIVDLGTLTWTYRGNGVFTSVGLAGYSKRNSDICYCSAYKGVGGGAIANLGDKCIQCGNSYYATGAINIKDTAYSDAAIFKAAMSGVMLCYELATPIVIDLDPVQIATIANQTNNVWADAGDVTVEYAADLKTYIDNKIAAAVAAMS